METSSRGEMTIDGLAFQERAHGDAEDRGAPAGGAGSGRPASGDDARRSGGSGESRGAPLPTWVRITLIVVSLLLLAIGIAGLVLPGIQGIVTILAGLALLSLVSRSTHRALRWSLGPWPKLRKRVERHRHRFRNWLHRTVERMRR